MAEAAEKGFTLVEMLVVLGIIGLLMAISLPAISEARQKAKARLARADVAMVSQAIIAYYQEYEDESLIGGNAAWVSRLTGNNPRNYIFMDIPPSKLDGGQIVDPWDTPLRIDPPTLLNDFSSEDTQSYATRVFLKNRIGYNP